MATGLNEFLKHIKNNPQNDTLIDRFMALLAELETNARHPYLEKLFLLLFEHNPHGALRAAYFNLQTTRTEAVGPLLEMEALKWVELSFRKLGKDQHASLVNEEIVRQQKQLPPPIPDRRKKKTAVDSAPKAAKPEEKKAADARFTTQRADFIASLYESFAKQLLDALETQLMSFTGELKADKVAVHLIKSFRRVYREMSSTLRNALAVFGHNPLLFDEKDQFREELVQVFLRSPPFRKNQDRIAAQRIRLVASLLTAWFDQQQAIPEAARNIDQDRLQSKLLEIAISGVLLFED